MASLTTINQSIMQGTLIKRTTIDLVGGILCNICQMTFATKNGYDSHYRSHGACTEIIYTCKLCYKEVAGFPNFRGHCYTSHVIKERYKCEQCCKQFSKISNLKEHVNKIHKFKCPRCRKEFSNKKEMLLHKIIHDGLEQPPYNCNVCNIEIDTADDCKAHIDKHLKFLYSCPICNESLSEKDNAANHIKKHFGEVLTEGKNEEDGAKSSGDASEEFSGIMCQFCALILEDRVKFDAHFSCEHGDEDIVYMCVECGQSFEKYSVFKSHCDDHMLKNKYSCQLCKKTFQRLSMLAMHTAACQSAGGARGQKVYACPVCKRGFASVWRWRVHLRAAHDMDRQLPCPHRRCDRICETPKELFLHQQSHEIKNKNFCSQCRLVFTNVSSCERHLDVHKKKVFFCPICKRNGKDKKVIMKHITKHFEIVSHLCRICSKIFTTKKGLISHLETHKKVKSYSCTYCNKSFTKPSHLEQHVNTHTGTKPYKCPACKKSFSNYPNWLKHVRRMHHEESIYIKNPIIGSQSDDEDDEKEIATDKKNESKSINSVKNDLRADNTKDNESQSIDTLNDLCADNTKDNESQSIDSGNNDLCTDNTKDDKAESMDSINNDLCTDNSKDNKSQPIDSEDKDMCNDNAEGKESKSINSVNMCTDNTNYNKKDQASFIKEPISNPSIDGKIITQKSHSKKTIDMVINEALSGMDECSAMEIAIDKKYEVPNNFVTNCNNGQLSINDSIRLPIAKDQPILLLNPCFDEVNHNISFKIIGQIPEQSANICNKAFTTVIPTEIPLESEKINETTQKEDGKPISTSDEQDLNANKPYKCPICEKSFAKYSYMTKHTVRVHHINSIDIKQLIIDQNDETNDDGSSMEVVNDEDRMSKDTKKVEADEKISNLETQDDTYIPSRQVSCGVGQDDINSKRFKCTICDKTFLKYPYMKKHVRKIHNRSFKNKDSVKDTKSTDESSVTEVGTDKKNEISTDNTKDDNNKKLLSSVQNDASVDLKPHKCSVCNKAFAKSTYVTQHIRKVHMKKNKDIKNPNIEPKESVDDLSIIDTSVDGENDVSMDNVSDDMSVPNLHIDQPISNIELAKKHQCPICEKSFAQGSYCRKHVSRVHNKKCINVKSPIYDYTSSYAVGTLIETEQQISTPADYLANELPNIGSISNIINQPSTPDYPNDIDDANVSSDFANVRLEYYIFNEQNDSPMDIVPTIQDGKYLLNENSIVNGTISKDLFQDSSNNAISKDLYQNNGNDNNFPKDLQYTGSEANAPIVRELFNENGEAITVVEKDLFNVHNKENNVGKDLYSGNSRENDNPIDILEYIADMPQNNTMFVPVVPQAPLAAQAVTYPCEYGPEFSAGVEPGPGDYIDLDDHMLPHIDPLLTINSDQVQSDVYAYGCQGDASYGYEMAAAPGWHPPIITKLCDQYAYYGEMPEASRVPIMNTDIF